jgi:hypothetical protein
MDSTHPLSEHPTQVVGWLEVLMVLMPETVKVEVSSYVLVVALVALWIWRRYSSPREGGGRSE